MVVGGGTLQDQGRGEDDPGFMLEMYVKQVTNMASNLGGFRYEIESFGWKV